MCALCGVLGGSGHWTDAAARPGVFTRNIDASQPGGERGHRIPCASRVLAYYGLTLSDWQASSLILSTATGKTELVEELRHLGGAPEELLRRPRTPLAVRMHARLGVWKGGQQQGRFPTLRDAACGRSSG